MAWNRTPSSRRGHGDNVTSMAWGARNLISTQDTSVPKLVLDHLGPTDDKAYLEAYKYKKLERGEDPVQRVLYEHSLTYQGLSYNKQD